MSSSALTAHDIDLVVKKISERHRRMLRRALSLSLFAHVLFVFFFSVISHITISRSAGRSRELVMVRSVPFVVPPGTVPEVTKAPPPAGSQRSPEIKTRKKVKEVTKKPKAAVVAAVKKPDLSWREKVSSTIEKKKTYQPPNYSWRENVTKTIAEQNKIPVIKSEKPQPVHQPSAAAGDKQQEAVLSAYIEGLGNSIKANWSMPEEMNKRFQGLSCDIEIKLEPDGTVRFLQISRSSGNNTFDYYAKDAVLKTDTYEAPPKILLDLIRHDKLVLEFKP